MDVRPYREADRDACLAIMDSTAEGDRGRFEEFLAAPTGPYLVMDHNEVVVGCGGYVIGPEAGAASLVWGAIRKDLRGQGLGRFLLMYRLREIGKAGGIATVRVETSRSAASFFEHQGFHAAGAVGNRVEMVKKLTVCG